MKHLIQISTSLALNILLAFLCWRMGNLFEPADFTAATFNERGDWYDLVHQSHNAFHSWRLDPFLHGLVPKNDAAELVFLALLLAIFAIGTTLLLKQIQPATPLVRHALDALLLGLLILYLWGWDTVSVSSLAWLPFAAWLLSLPKRRGWQTVVFLSLIFIGLRLAASANHAIAIIFTAAIILAWIGKRGSSALGSFPAGLIICILIAITSWSLPTPQFPDYPKLAHVVADDGLEGHIMPMVGMSTPIPLIDRQFIKTNYQPFVALLLGCQILLFLLIPISRTNRGALASLAILLLLAGDVLLPEIFSHILPISVIQRTIPGLFHVALTPLIFGIALLFLFAQAASTKIPVHYVATMGLLLLLIQIPNDTRQALPPQGALQDRQGTITRNRISERASRLKPTEGASLFELAASPSFNVFKREGLWLLDRKHMINKAAYRSPLRAPWKLKVNAGASGASSPQELQVLFDRDINTRWTIGGGRQLGNEWLQLELDRPVTLNGIALLIPKHFGSDFPRGIRISTSQACNVNQKSGFPYQMLIEIPTWEGPIEFTPKGYPFYGGQSDVQITFANSGTGRCWLIEQIGQTDKSDWSIAEIKFLFAPHSSALTKNNGTK